MKRTMSMKHGFPGRALALALAAVFLLGSGAAFAADSSDYKVVDGILIYYATVPAELIRGHPKGHPEAVMHGGVPSGKHFHHIIIALFEAKKMERITDAEVTATVGEVGLGRKKKLLEPFTVAGALTYGNYFKFANSTTYEIDIEVRRPGSAEVVKTRFEYRHH